MLYLSQLIHAVTRKRCSAPTWQILAPVSSPPRARRLRSIRLPKRFGSVTKSKAKYVVPQADRTMVIPFKKPNVLFSWDNGFFAALAAEVGDRSTVQGMLAYAEKYWNPTWINGGLHYPRNDDYAASGTAPETLPTPPILQADRFVSPRVNTLTGNALLALARINIKDGFFDMFNSPWTSEHFKQPYLADVSYPQWVVSRAVFDERKQALVATIKPSTRTGPAQRASFSVSNLPATESFNIWANNRLVGKIKQGTAASMSKAFEIASIDGRLRVATTTDKPIDLIVQRVP